MKIALASDLHLEFGRFNIVNSQNADVLILSGDICVASELTVRMPDIDVDSRSAMFHQFFDDCCSKFNHVVYVAGNHEHYHGDFATTINHLKSMLKHHKNLYILDKETVVIDDITFIGTTLWTDMNKDDPITLLNVSRSMNDFRIIKNSNRLIDIKVPIYKDNDPQYVIGMETKSGVPDALQPEDVSAEHKICLTYIKDVIEKDSDKKYVVVGHHAPSERSIHDRFSSNAAMSGAYVSSLDEFIMDHPQILLWTHGHTHNAFDYMIGDTRVVCNPRGYVGYELRASAFALQYITV